MFYKKSKDTTCQHIDLVLGGAILAMIFIMGLIMSKTLYCSTSAEELLRQRRALMDSIKPAAACATVGIGGAAILGEGIYSIIHHCENQQPFKLTDLIDYIALPFIFVFWIFCFVRIVACHSAYGESPLQDLLTRLWIGGSILATPFMSIDMINKFEQTGTLVPGNILENYEWISIGFGTAFVMWVFLYTVFYQGEDDSFLYGTAHFMGSCFYGYAACAICISKFESYEASVHLFGHDVPIGDMLFWTGIGSLTIPTVVYLCIILLKCARGGGEQNEFRDVSDYSAINMGKGQEKQSALYG